MSGPNDRIGALGREAQRVEEDCHYSARSHFVAARTWTNVHFILGIPSAILAGLAGVSGFNGSDQLAGALGILAAALVSVITFLNPNERASTHQGAGTKYNGLRRRLRVFREISLLGAINEKECEGELKSLGEEKDEADHSSPQIPEYAYRWAKSGIERGEADYMVDKRLPSDS